MVIEKVSQDLRIVFFRIIMEWRQKFGVFYFVP